MVRDVARATARTAKVTPAGWWWGAFLGYSVLSRFVGRTELSMDPAVPRDSGSRTGAVQVIAALLAAVAAALWIITMQRVVTEQAAAATPAPTVAP